MLLHHRKWNGTEIPNITELEDKARKDSIASGLPNTDASEVGEIG